LSYFARLVFPGESFVGHNLEIFPDNFYYTIDFFENFIIPESEYLKTFPHQVFFLLQRMGRRQFQ
jgi:hypothetical protein